MGVGVFVDRSETDQRHQHVGVPVDVPEDAPEYMRDAGFTDYQAGCGILGDNGGERVDERCIMFLPEPFGQAAVRRYGGAILPGRLRGQGLKGVDASFGVNNDRRDICIDETPDLGFIADHRILGDKQNVTVIDPGAYRVRDVHADAKLPDGDFLQSHDTLRRIERVSCATRSHPAR